MPPLLSYYLFRIYPQTYSFQILFWASTTCKLPNFIILGQPESPLILISFVMSKYAFITAISLLKLNIGRFFFKEIMGPQIWVYGLNFNSIFPSVPEINALDKSDRIRVPFFLKRYRTLKRKKLLIFSSMGHILKLSEIVCT